MEDSNSKLSEKIVRLEVSQTENLNELKASHNNFLKQLTDTLNSKKSSNLEPLLQKLIATLQIVGSEVKEQRNLQQQLKTWRDCTSGSKEV